MVLYISLMCFWWAPNNSCQLFSAADLDANNSEQNEHGLHVEQRRMGTSRTSGLRWWTNLPAGDPWWRHHGGSHRAVVKLVRQQGWGRTWPWTSGARGGGGGVGWGGRREEGKGSAWPWLQTPPVGMQVRGIGRTVVVKAVGQLDVCVAGGGMGTESPKNGANTNQDKLLKR